jgi:hypothetical protein
MLCNNATPKGKAHPRHLLIIDAVEGLEAMVGERDAFGQERDRRSRVAQLIRVAKKIGVHVAFIVEEPVVDARLPEQFVTDLVVRVRHVQDGEYSQRSVEIEKCRAVAHVRGQHELCIRSGHGSSTGRIKHLDDPLVPWKVDNGAKLVEGKLFDYTRGDGKPCHPLAHLYVIQSLYHWNRVLREQVADIPQLIGSPTFDLKPLDDQLRLPGVAATSPRGFVAVLLGEPTTYKGGLGRRFLAQVFQNEGKPLLEWFIGAGATDVANRPGVAVLLTTQWIDHSVLVEKIEQHLAYTQTEYEGLENNLKRRVLCQRFGARHMTSGAFITTLNAYISEAQKILLGAKDWKEVSPQPGSAEGHRIKERQRHSHRIRVVLEDWSILLETYPNLKRDPLLLTSVLALFRREGVSALVSSTQAGEPNATALRDANELRQLDETQILAWSVPFYGDRRVAITANPTGTSKRRSPIFELLVKTNASESLEVKRHFDLYADVDIGKPHRIPLVIRLYVGSHVAEETESSRPQFTRVLRDSFTQLFAAPAGEETVRLEPYTQYDRLFTFADVLDASHLDHTLVFQIDEFWIVDRGMSLMDLTDYWNAPVAWTEHNIDVRGNPGITVLDAGTKEEADPIFFYQPHYHCLADASNAGVPLISSCEDILKTIPSQPPKYNPEGVPHVTTARTDLRRWQFFVRRKDGGSPNSPANQRICVDSIPYLWDFGIILADRDLWKRHKLLSIGTADLSVSKIWNSLCFHDKLRFGDDPYKVRVTWDMFFEVCRAIADLEGIPAFDVDLSTVETLSCLLLEVWASIQETLDPGAYSEHGFKVLTENETRRGDRPGLLRLIETYNMSLFAALAQIVYTCPQLRAARRHVFREHASPRAVASREWYHTASAIMQSTPDVKYVPLSLPGTHSVRGDWHLAAAKGSRSEVLAHRTLDMLCNRRNNLLRLQDGIGLPTRDILPDVSCGDLPTSMICFDENANRRIPLSYRDICALGCRPERRDFSWIWRSQISHYQRDSFYWRRWIARMIEEHHNWFVPEVRSDAEAVREVLKGKRASDNFLKHTKIPRQKVQEMQQRYNELCEIIASALRGSKVPS